MRYFGCHIVLFGLLIGDLCAQSSIDVNASVDTAYHIFGDKVSVTIEVGPIGADAQITTLPPVLDTVQSGSSLGGVEILEEKPWDYANGLKHSEIILGAYDTGYQFYEIPVVVTQSGVTDTLMSNAAFFYISPVPMDSLGLAPIKEIIEEPLTLEDFKNIIYITLGALLLIGLLIWFLRRRKKKTVPEEKYIPYVPPHELALQKLKSLKEESLWQRGEVKAYQSRLTHIIREYIEKAMNVPALEMTSGEIVTALRSKYVNSEQLGALSNILNIADLVKFAKGKPAVDIHVDLMKKAESFIVETTRQKQQQGEEE